MNDESFLSEYAAVIYDIYARTGADFIWVDDDVRYGHMPIGNGCFCDICIGKFNRETIIRLTVRDLSQSLKTAM